ncbi:translation initiation factor IF-3, mitochondrial [Pholidichthys leucotaenia]
MSAGCVWWVLSQAMKSACGGTPLRRTPVLRFTICSNRHKNILDCSWRSSPFSTEAQDSEGTPTTLKKQQHKPRGRATIASVGRKIPERHIQVIGETGDNLGVMHRADVIRVMDEGGLKLVLLNGNKEPPVYQLMSGKQIYEEQMKQREKNKGKAAPTQVKELAFSIGIASHDLLAKLRQVQSWLEKKHHVRIILRSRHRTQAAGLDASLEQMVDQMEGVFGFVSTPKVIRNGQVATCILRPPSAKELSQERKNKASESQPLGPASEDAQSDASPVCSTDTTEGSKQP